MSSPVNQAAAFAALTAAVARFFSAPSQARSAMVRALLPACESGRAGAGRGQAGRRGKAGAGPAAEDLRGVSASLAEAARQAAKAVDETLLFEVRKFATLAGASETLMGAAGALEGAARALGRGDGGRCARLLVTAKRHAQRAARLADEGSAGALENPHVPESIKTREIHLRLSRSADAAHQAADLLGEMNALNHD